MLNAGSVTVNVEARISGIERDLRRASRLVQDFGRTSQSASRQLQQGFSRINVSGATRSVDELRRSASRLGPIFARAGQSASRSFRDIERSAGSASRSISGLSSSGRGIGRSLGGLGRAAIAAGTAFAGIAAVRDITGISTQFTALTRSLETTTGSAEEAARLLAFVEQTSNQLGTSVLTSGQQFASLVASTSSANISLEDTQRLFTSISQAGRVLGLDNEKLSRAFVAVSQVASRNRVSLEEISGQLAEALPGSLGIAAKALGLTNQEFIKLVESGNLTAKQLLPALSRELENRFAGSAERASTTFAAATGRVATSFTLLRRRLGDFITQSPEVVQLLDTISGSMRSLIGALNSGAGTIDTIVSGFSRLNAAALGNAEAIASLNTSTLR